MKLREFYTRFYEGYRIEVGNFKNHFEVYILRTDDYERKDPLCKKFLKKKDYPTVEHAFSSARAEITEINYRTLA